jgi:hypothetical protein
MILLILIFYYTTKQSKEYSIYNGSISRTIANIKRQQRLATFFGYRVTIYFQAMQYRCEIMQN